MIEQYTRTGKEPITLAIIDRNPVSIYLGHAIRAARIERRVFVLRIDPYFAKHLTRGGLIETNLGVETAHGFEQPCDSQRRKLAGEERLIPRSRDKRLRGQVIHLI